MQAVALKAYDIRGIVDQDLFTEDAYFIGKAFGSWMQTQGLRQCVLGYDGRLTSGDYSYLAIEGMRDSGVDVTDVGLVTTPTVYFALKHGHFDAGMIITASHNPSEHNGFKMLTQAGPFWGEEIQLLGNMMAAGELKSAAQPGTLVHKDIKAEYLQFLLNLVQPVTGKAMHVIWDTGNGAAGYIIHDLVAKLPGKHEVLFAEIDGHFPNHEANPCVEKNLAVLQQTVVESGADLGIALDGDADRLGVIDREGGFFYGDQLLMYLAREFLREHPGEKVMVEVKATMTFAEEIRKYGGVPLLCQAGHSSIKDRMQREQIKMAGETSGHIYWGENYNLDDGLYSALKLLNILQSQGQDLAEFRHSLPVTYSTKEERYAVEDVRKFKIVEEIKQRLTVEHDPRIVEIVDVDGIRVTYPEGWVLIRASNTQADLSTRAEGKTPEDLKRMEEIIKEQLQLSGVVV